VAEKDLKQPELTSGKANAHIKIELGKAKIYIPSNDKLSKRKSSGNRLLAGEIDL